MSYRDNNKIFEALLIIILFLIAFSYLSSGYKFFNLGAYHYDEGIVMYGASNILEGQVPYRDFWTLYTPGVFFLLAIVFKIFGANIEVSRLFTFVVLSITCCGIYFLVRSLCQRIIGLFTFLLTLGWLKSFIVYNRPGQFAILFYILSLFCLKELFKSKKDAWFIIIGAISGIIFLFRQDFGFYIFISNILVVFLASLEDFKIDRYKSEFLRFLKEVAYLFLGLVLVVLPFLFYLIFNSALHEFINDTVYFPVAIYPKVRRLPFPRFGIKDIVFYYPGAIFLLTFIRLLFSKYRFKFYGQNYPGLRFFLLFSGLGFLNYTSVRTSMTHLSPTMIPAIILFALLINDFFRLVARVKLNLYLRFLALCLCYAMIVHFSQPFFKIHGKQKPKFTEFIQKNSLLNVNRARGFYDPSELAQSQALAVNYIQSKTLRNEKIFVANTQHDQLLNSDVVFYFLAERDSPTKYYELHPGLTDTLNVQKKIIEDLLHSNVRYIVFCRDYRFTMLESNSSSHSSNVKALDNFIKENFKLEKDFGLYAILRHI